MTSDRNPADLALHALPPKEPAPLQYQDRAVPMWTQGISFLFALGSGASLLAVAAFVVFFYQLVAQDGQRLLASLLTIGAMVPVLGVIIFDVGHARSLAGFRHIRTRNEVVGRAIIAVFAAGTFAFLHPLLVAPFVLSGLTSWLAFFGAARWIPKEPMWDFRPEEAASFLAGRDQRAVALANAAWGDSALLDGLHKSIALLGLITGFAVGSWLTAQGVLNIAAVAAVALVSGWAAHALAAYFRQSSKADTERRHLANEVILLPAPPVPPDKSDKSVLIVSHLSVQSSNGEPLLSDVSFHAEPGDIIGLSGDSSAGKSVLLRALQAPHDLTGLRVEGHVSLDGHALWKRSARPRPVSAVLVPETLLCVPGGGAHNLSCFAGEGQLDRARRALQSLVFTSDTVDRIVASTDVRQLSQTEQKALSFARALALRPDLLLFDRPEDGATDGLLDALGEQIRAAARLGGITLLVTENRQLLERCDKLLMLQHGRVIEFASSAEIRQRLSTGWRRFVTTRDLDNEEALDQWICSNFRRDGDEGNRRAVCMVANEMLSVACQSARGVHTERETISFEFKHRAGSCQLRLIDAQLALSSGAMEKARTAAATSAEGERLSPLAKILRDCLDVKTGTPESGFSMQATIKTYDPRLVDPRKRQANASSRT